MQQKDYLFGTLRISRILCYGQGDRKRRECRKGHFILRKKGKDIYVAFVVKRSSISTVLGYKR